MATYDVYKSNASGEWWAGVVDSANESTALRQARQQYPSRNDTDAIRVSLRSQERQDAIDAAAFDREIRKAELRGPATYADKCKARKIAYLEKCKENLIRSLDKNVAVLGGLTPAVEAVAERIEERFQEAVVKITE